MVYNLITKSKFYYARLARVENKFKRIKKKNLSVEVQMVLVEVIMSNSLNRENFTWVY